MRGLGFNAIEGAAFLGLLVPLILFYFLKLRRPLVKIPSLALWQQVINDRRVNSPFQRFKRNILLMLQIAALLLLVFSLMQPFFPSGADRARYLPIIVDCSASMGALDKPGGKTRLDEAKENVGRIIDNLLPDQKVCLIAMHQSARTTVDFTNNKIQLRKALADLQVEPSASKVEDALRIAQALSRTYPIEKVGLFTDGNIPAKIDFELPFHLDYQKMSPAGANIGIAGINAVRRQTDWEIFVRVDATKAGPMSGTVELYQNGKKVGEDTVALEPGSSQRLLFRVETSQAVQLEVRLKPSGFDALDVDNVAYLELPVPRPLLVYCPEELHTYQRALKGFKNIQLQSTLPAEGQGTVDLLITNQVADKGRAAPVTLRVGMVPDDLSKLIGVKSSLAEVVDWQRNSPLLTHVDLNDVQISDQPFIEGETREKDFEKLGYEVLAHGKTGPLILRREREGNEVYSLLFSTDRSTLPYRIGFPILVSNLVDMALAKAELSEVKGTTTGVLPPRTLDPNQTYTVIAPNGETNTVKSSNDGQLSAIAAPQVGRYQIKSNSGLVAAVGVSLIQPSETSLETVDELQFRELSVASSSQLLKNDYPLWGWIALAAFCMLIIEWWYYQKPPAGVVL